MEEIQKVIKRARPNQKSYQMEPVNVKWLKVESAIREISS